MSPLPTQFTDRWGGSREGLSYEDSVCWHLLLGFDANARAAVAEAQQRIARFGGMHMTPVRWLHVTVLLVGPAAALTREDIGDMLARARAHLARTPPVTVTVGRFLYSPEGIALAVSPASALSQVRAAAQAATSEVIGTSGRGEASPLPPHLTVCYSTCEQAAAPVIAKLGKAIPACEVTLDRLSLVVQNGPERLWDWRVAGTAPLGGHGSP